MGKNGNNVEKKLLPRKEPSQSRSRERVQKILDCTVSLLEQKGLEGVTTDMIAEEAEISIGSLYQFFPNKNSIIAALAERHFLILHEKFVETIPEKETLLKKDIPYLVKYFVETSLKIHFDYPEYMIVMRCIKSNPELAPIEKKYRSQFYPTMAEKIFKPLFPRIPMYRHMIVSQMIIDIVNTVFMELIAAERNNKHKRVAVTELERMFTLYVQHSFK